jgi:hypothetical protein
MWWLLMITITAAHLLALRHALLRSVGHRDVRVLKERMVRKASMAPKVLRVIMVFRGTRVRRVLANMARRDPKDSVVCKARRVRRVTRVALVSVDALVRKVLRVPMVWCQLVCASARLPLISAHLTNLP